MSSFNVYALNNSTEAILFRRQIMDNKKFEKLIDLIINEDEEHARAMFHDIVVEKSREIYENLMAQDEMQEGDQVGDLLDEIGHEEEGMTEEEDEFADIEVGDDGMGDDDSIEMGSDEMDHEGGEEDLEDRVVDLEDKLDELMAEFEQIMGGEEHGDEGEESFGDEEGAEDQDDEDMMEAADDEEDEEETLEEAIQLKKVSVTHGDNGEQTKSPVSSGPKMPGNGASAANIAKGGEAKGGTVKAPATIPGNYKNAPGSTFSEKGETAPKAKAGDNGSNTKSVIESKKSAKKIVK